MSIIENRNDDELRVNVTPNMSYEDIIRERERLIRLELAKRPRKPKTHGEKIADALVFGIVCAYAAALGAAGAAWANQMPETREIGAISQNVEG